VKQEINLAEVNSQLSHKGQPVDGVLVRCLFTLASIRCTGLLVPQFDQQTCHPPQLGMRGVTDRVAFNLLCLFTLMGKTNETSAYEKHQDRAAFNSLHLFTAQP
jgi:hypothetical protein